MVQPNSPSASQPLLDALRHLATSPHAAFYTPGHKRGKGIPKALEMLLGAKVFSADLPELPGLDNLFNPEGVIQAAQILAAQTFGAKQSWFLANGSTCGLEAAVLATCSPGDRLIVPRNLHQSVVSALILGGVIPIFVSPVVDENWGLAHGISIEGVEVALHQYPQVKGVLAVSPTYYGVCCDLGAIASLVHNHNIPLLVDEAHGPHFAFHPNLPSSALAQGADLTVQSTHKVLAALTQASMLHLQGDRIHPYQISRALQLVQSSSPSYLLLASLDAARAQMDEAGESLMAYAITLAAQAHEAIARIPGLRVLDLDHLDTSAAAHLDPTRLTVDVSGLCITGFDADEVLSGELGVIAELPGLNTLTFIISLGNRVEEIEQLVQAFQKLASRYHPSTESSVEKGHSAIAQISDFPDMPLVSIPALSPRDAFFAESEAVAIAQSIGRISTETLCPYPPGIPVLLPGERITAEAVQILQQVHEAGGVITGSVDSSLECLQVVRE